MTEAQQMSSADAAWLHMDRPTNLMVVTAALWFDEPVDWERVREIIATRLVERYPRFRQRVVEGRAPLSGPHWEDDPGFELDEHLHRVQLPRPGGPTQLQALVGELMSTPLDRSKPLWSFEFVDGYRDGAAMVGRLHHCIADGIALARVLLSLTDEAPDVGIAPATDEHRGSLEAALPGPAAGALAAVRGAAGAVAHEAVEVARHPDHLLDIAATAAEDAETLAKLVLPGTDPQTPLKGELGIPQRVAWSAPFPLQEVKDKGHETGTTVNDLVVTAMTGALRRYLQGRDVLVDELTAIVPFNLRPLDQPLPAELGNRFGLVFLALPVGVRARRRRLAEVHRQMERIKHSHEGAVSYGVLGALGRAPMQVEKLLVDQFSAKGTAVITNVPGPAQPVYLAGTPVRGVLVWAPRSGSVAMSVAIFSYAGEITVGLTVDAGLVPDPKKIVTGFGGELRALLRLKPEPVG